MSPKKPATKSKTTKPLRAGKPTKTLTLHQVIFPVNARYADVFAFLIADPFFKRTYDLATKRRVNAAMQGLREQAIERDETIHRLSIEVRETRNELIELRQRIAKPLLPKSTEKSALGQALDKGLAAAGATLTSDDEITAVGDPDPELADDLEDDEIEGSVPDVDDDKADDLEADEIIDESEPGPDEVVDATFDPSTFENSAEPPPIDAEIG